ncbi:MAG: PAS domain-containing protein [Deltaproteobacteria bacterium]|nr:PAS domain-containing protein [Deltaproteobacteria bacterium]
MPEWEEDSTGNLILETGKDDNIAYVYLINSHGTVVHHSNPSFEGMPSAWRPQLDNEDQVQSRVRKLTDGAEVYDMAKRFSPHQSLLMNYDHKDVMGHRQNMAFHQHSDNIIILGLKMTAFEEARRSDIHHAVIMAGILVALGSGALFFIFVIQNYYLVDRTLKETRDYTRQVVANMANGLLSVNPEGRIVSYNLLAMELLGLKETELEGLDLRSVIDFNATGIDDTLLQSKPVLEREFLHKSKSGAVIPMSLSVTPILDEKNTCTGAVIVLRDLREIRQLEKKVRHSEKLAAIGELAAGVAHEIRNPLSSIKGFARFLSHSLSDVNDLLTFARPSEPELAATDLFELVEHTVRLLETDARSRNVKIRSKINPDLSRFLLDANQITQALLNLMLNALQEVDDGGTVEVGADVDDSGSRLHIWVEDDGPGIPNDKKKKILILFLPPVKKEPVWVLPLFVKLWKTTAVNFRLRVRCPGKPEVVDLPLPFQSDQNRKS